jgi:hypothetical protein
VLFGSDANNCGACGHSCQGGLCKSGACQPLVLGTGDPTDLAVDTSGVYWTDVVAGTVNVCALDGCNLHPTVLSTDAPLGPITLDTSNVYFATPSNDIVQCPKAGCGANPNLLTLANGTVFSMVLQANTLYWSTASGTVSSCPTSGCASATTTLATQQGFPQPIMVDSSFVYWLNPSLNQVLSCALTGCNQMPTLLSSMPMSSGEFEGIGVTSGELYLTTAVNGMGTVAKIGAFGGAGQTPTLVVPNLLNPVAIVADASGIYWNDIGNANIGRANLDGTNVRMIAPPGQGSNGSGSVATDANSVYWAGNQGVMKLAK